MGNRVTNADLEAVLGRYIHAVDAVGIIHEGFRMDEGSKVNGRAFRLYRNDGTEAPGTIHGYLGTTKTEAWDRLHTLAKAFEDAAYYGRLSN